MLSLLQLLLGPFLRLFRSRRHLMMENLVLRQQLAVLKAQTPKAPSVRQIVLSAGPEALVGVEEFAVPGHTRNGRPLAQGRFSSLLGNAIQKKESLAGRKKITRELRDLIFQMVAENPTWFGGAPRIHGELLRLGFDISERTVSRARFTSVG